ncbi:MAG: hypothetical protein Q9216_003908 [Gyalolechia sp. 2 TL-2023]
MSQKLRRLGISNRVDDSSATIGKRYSRNDELGTPLGITVDFQSVKDNTFTLRDRDSTKQLQEEDRVATPTARQRSAFSEMAFVTNVSSTVEAMDRRFAGISTLDTSSAQTNASLSGSLFDQVLENERTYANQCYFMPCDEQEQTRLAITHQCFTSILNGQRSFQTIPRSARRILDVGTGTGEWAIAIAERFPNAEVVATDITCFQPTDVPPNVFFEIDDAQEEWTYAEPFDFIHIRGLSGAFRDWTTVYKEAFKHLQPNGILEVTDFDVIQMTEQIPDSYLSIYNGACVSAAERSGSSIGLDHMKKTILERAGFSFAKTRTFDVPLGTWSSDLRKKVAGKMALISMLEGLEATSLRLLTQHSGFKPEDVRDLCEKVKEELMRPGVSLGPAMAPPVATAKLGLSYPLYASDFDPQNDSFLLVGGGGGETRTGVGNKIVIPSQPKKRSESTSKKQTISEVVDIDLSRDEDSVTSLAVASSTSSSVTAFAGINSSEKDQNAGRNEHLRSFRLEYPPRKNIDGTSENGGDTREYKGQTAPLGRASLFKPSTATKKETYQRITRLSRPCKVNGGQLGAIATGLAPEGEIVLFDAKTNGPMGPWVEARLPLGKGKEAADIDIIGLHDTEDSAPGTFAVAYCTDYEVYTFTMKLKQKTKPEPQLAHSEPLPDVFAGDRNRPKFRSLRFITPHLLLLLQNKPNRKGADLILLELSSSLQGRILSRKHLHSGINSATALSVTHLPSSVSSQPSQHAVAVAGQDTSISIFTLEHPQIPPFKSLKFRLYTLLRSVHPLQITSLSFSTFSPPPEPQKSTPPQYIKLASTSVKDTIVVHTFPLLPYPPPSSNSPRRRYVLQSPGRSETTSLTFSILISALTIAIGAFLLQAFAEIRGGTPAYLGAKGWLSQRVHDYIAVPYILDNHTSISSISTRGSSSLSSIQDQATDTLSTLQASVTDTSEQAKQAISSALDAASAAASELSDASEAYRATAAPTVSSAASSASSPLSSKYHHIRDLLSRHHHHRRHESSATDNAIPHMLIRNDEEGNLKAGFHRVGQEGGHAVKKFEELSRKEKEAWKERLLEAGVWTVEEGEKVLKGVFFGGAAVAVGQVVGRAVG